MRGVQNNFFNKFLFLLTILSITMIVSGCSMDKSYPIRTNEIRTDTGNSGTQNNVQTGDNSETSTTNNQVVQANKDLPDVILKDLKIYDQSLKRNVELSEPITASDPIEITIVLKNQGNTPYVGPKGNAPVIVTMITEAYPSNLYFYSNNYSTLNPGEERTYKTNVIKFRTLGTFDVRIFPSIQYTSNQPEELSIENNEMSLIWTIKAK